MIGTDLHTFLICVHHTRCCGQLVRSATCTFYAHMHVHIVCPHAHCMFETFEVIALYLSCNQLRSTMKTSSHLQSNCFVR